MAFGQDINFNNFSWDFQKHPGDLEAQFLCLMTHAPKLFRCLWYIYSLLNLVKMEFFNKQSGLGFQCSLSSESGWLADDNWLDLHNVQHTSNNHSNFLCFHKPERDKGLTKALKQRI